MCFVQTEFAWRISETEARGTEPEISSQQPRGLANGTAARHLGPLPRIPALLQLTFHPAHQRNRILLYNQVNTNAKPASYKVVVTFREGKSQALRGILTVF